MKRIMQMLLIGVLMLSFHSCTKSNAASIVSKEKKPPPVVSYKIVQGTHSYDTKTFTKNPSGCVTFIEKREACICGDDELVDMEVCGSYTIEKHTQ